MSRQTFVRLPTQHGRSNWVDVAEIFAIVERAEGAQVYLRCSDLPVFTVLDGRAIFDQLLDDCAEVTSP